MTKKKPTEEEIQEAVEFFLYKVSDEGIAYAIQNYFPTEEAPEDLKKACLKAAEAIDEVVGLCVKYSKKYDLGYYC